MNTTTPKIPHPLLDKIASDHQLKSDYHLSRFLGVKAPVLSKIRTGYVDPSSGRKYRVSGDTMIAIHEKTGMPIAQIKALAGIA